jgi:hypothetical protein
MIVDTQMIKRKESKLSTTENKHITKIKEERKKVNDMQGNQKTIKWQ